MTKFGGAQFSRDLLARDELIRNGLADLVRAGATAGAITGGFLDALNDQLGIISLGGGFYDAANKLIYNATAGYSADLGTAAQHIGSAVVGGSVAGAYDGDTTGSGFWGTANNPGNSYIGQNFGAGTERHIRRVRFATSNVNRTAFSVKVQYSDNGAAWTDVATFVPVAMSGWDTPYDLPATAVHRYWRVLQNAGTTGSGFDWECYEIEWLELASLDMTPWTVSYTALAAPNAVRVYFIFEPVDAVVLDADLKAWASRDGGTNYSQGPLAVVADLGSGKKLVAADCVVGAQPSGTAIRVKVTTHNSKRLKVHELAGTWG